MVGIGFLFIFMAGAGGISGGCSASSISARFYLLVLRWCWPLGFVAIIAGWTTTEVGRQPWVAQGILRTADAASPIPSMSIAVFVALFVLVYGVVFGAGIRYIRRLIKKGPEAKPARRSRDSGKSTDFCGARRGPVSGNVAIVLQRVE